MIDKWTILNLPCREDRRYISVSGALRFQVPIEKIRFWHGYDLTDFESFEDAKNAVRKDMPELLDIRPNLPQAEYGKFLMLWNIARYLRDLASQNRIEALVHDGLMLAETICPSFDWFEDVIGELTDYDPNFKMLTISLHNGWIDKLRKTEAIKPSSFIIKGILSWDNFGRVYSSQGAQIVLDRIKTQRWTVRSNSVLVPRKSDAKDWDEGFYSTWLPLGSDYPGAWLGSNSFPDLPGLRGEFQRLLS